MTSIILLAVSGDICRVEVNVPRQLQGLWYPTKMRPSRYNMKFVANQATTKIFRYCCRPKKQNNAVSISSVPTTKNTYLYSIDRIGSWYCKIRALPALLISLEIPVTDSKTPDKNRNTRTGLSLSIRSNQNIVS